MIQVYGLVYYALEYAQRSIWSILATAGEEIDITVIDSRSSRSEEIASWGHQAVDDGLIRRFVSASTNCKGAGTVWAFNNFPPEEDFAVFTDLDIIAKPGWLDQVKQGMQYNLVSGFSLDMSNYVEPNFGFTEEGFGNWLMGINIDFYRRYLEKYDHHQDSLIIQEAGGLVSKSPLELGHLGWDTWKDYPEYWQEKLEPIDWQASEPAQFEVYERRGCN